MESVAPGLGLSCTYLLNTPLSYFLMSRRSSPSCFGRELGVDGRMTGLPFLSSGAPSVPSDARTTTREVMGESAAPSSGSSKMNREV